MPSFPLHRSTLAQVMEKMSNPTPIDPRIRRALDALRDIHTVDLRGISFGLGLSYSHFRHLFKKEVGISAQCFVKLTRLERAKYLLETSFLTIKEITALLGVNDISHFVRDFKMLYGQTPSMVRRLSHNPQRFAKDGHNSQ
jgi:AraC-like DNA-binding protein